jgi:hypothetical protein
MMIPGSDAPKNIPSGVPGGNIPRSTQGKNIPEELLDCGKDCVDPEVCVEKGCVLYGNAESGATAAPPPQGGDVNPFE